MDNLFKNGAVALVIACLITLGGWAWLPQRDLDLPEDFNLEDYIDIDDIKGDTGPRGAAGAQGVAGPQGPAGPRGVAGADGASVSLEDVLNALDAREAKESGDMDFSGGPGNFSNEFEVEEGEYTVKIKHFGPDYFGVSVIYDGDVYTLVDTNGHYSATITHELDNDEDIVLKVSASGEWSVEIERVDD